MKNINKKLTLINYNDTNRANSAIQYLVIHYVGAVSSAKNNADYFYNTYRGASAHFFVDEHEIWQIVEENDTSWHCGTTGTYYSNCRNSSSIGIEMCVKNNGQWYFEEATVQNTVELVQYLVNKYGIPRERILRHYDVTRKVCGEPYVRDSGAWNNFLDRVYGAQPTPAPEPPAPQPSGDAYPGYLIKKGSKGDNVRKIQSKVGTAVDGDFGNNTHNAVVNFQKSVGLSADGIVGPNTWNAMFNGSSPTPQPQSFGTGDRVQIKSSATNYVTGEKIPSSYKGKTYSIMQMGSSGTKALIKELYSWVYTRDLTKV